MAVKTYKYTDNSKLSEHFKISEFKCKCGKKHDIKIDSNLVTLLEKVRSKLNSTACNIYSGYRCSAHDKSVGGSGSGPHTKGYAVDCYFLDDNRKRINSKYVASVIEEIGHKYGFAIRCGGSDLSSGNVHIDTKPRKWYGDEKVSMSKSISSLKAISDKKTGHTKFLTYINTPIEYYVNAKSGLNVRQSNDINSKIITTLKYKTKVKVYLTVGKWCKIDTNKWVYKDYLQMNAIK